MSSGYQEAQCVMLWPGYCLPVTDMLLLASMSINGVAGVGGGGVALRVGVSRTELRLQRKPGK